MRSKLKEVRISKQYTQEKLAQKVGINRAYYTNIERGCKTPSFAVAIKIKEALNYKKDDIFSQ